ncbi:MAG: glycosyltransferase [Atopobiaceae bacterium]|nr:glycosyltransferase [Atopobiaceae bacterium]
MIEFTLANVLFGGDDFAATCPDLYYRCETGSASPDGGELVIAGEVDFSTYLNALSIGKWRRYTVASSFELVLELSGDACEVDVIQMGPDATSTLESRHIEGSGSVHTERVDLSDLSGTLASFRLRTRGTVLLHASRYVTSLDAADIRPVRLALCTTTFKKERYITANIDSVRREILESAEPISSGFHMVVVDNGRTLDAGELSGGGVTVIPNANTGGSGGFARGMLEALDSGDTHVLLMDDDVHVLPESIKRTFNLLSLANDRYASAFVNGAMLNMASPQVQFEDVSQVLKSGKYARVKKNMDMSDPRDVIANELVDVEVESAYGAWWYSCIPTSAIRAHGLPLPMFVRCDDVEYGIRCKPTYMTMGGICVWHEQFEGRIRASVDQYQYTRNFLIMCAADSLDCVRPFMMRFSRTFHIYLRAMAYETCEIMLDGLEDYLAGPDRLISVPGDEVMRREGSKNEKLVPVSELDKRVVAKAPADPSMLGDNAPSNPMAFKVLEMMPHDRHAAPGFLLRERPAAVYYCRGAYPARRTLLRKVLVAYDASGENGHVRVMDKDRWKALRSRYDLLTGKMREDGDDIANSWHEAAPMLESEAFWRESLGVGSSD